MDVEKRQPDPKSQAGLILAHLQAGEPITTLVALRLYGCFRLGARIHQLRRLGWPIRGEMVHTPSGKHIARYFLDPSSPA